MKTAVISDIHGNYPALEAVLKEIGRLGCDRIISLGDVAGYYCMVNECIDELRTRGIVNLLGNHDTYILGLNQCPRSFTVNRCIEYQKRIISEENYVYLAKSLVAYDGDFLSARHGGWIDPIDEYVRNFDFRIAENSGTKIFASGHTHAQKIETLGGIVHFNPGSVGQPRDCDARAGFAVIDSGCNVELFRVAYDIDEIAYRMKEAGFEDRISLCLYEGTEIKTYGV